MDSKDGDLSMKRLFWLSLIFIALPAWAGQAHVEGIRVSTTSQRTRVVFDLSNPVPHNLFTLKKPARVVIDFSDTSLDKGTDPSLDGGGLVRDIRSGVHHETDLRVVLDLKKHSPVKSEFLPPSGSRGYRLVVDMQTGSQGNHAVRAVAETSHPVVVAVDAGHGGVDDGASGPDGIEEKNVTLAIARKLAAKLDATPGMKAFMTRKGDYYVGLKERLVEAHKANADLFISIHANAVANASYVKGAAVYFLSRHGASSTQARLLAQRENASAYVGPERLDEKDQVLASVLLDMSQTASIEASMNFADRLLKDLDKLGPLHKSQPQRANFVVLRSADIPSVLVETAFITNPHQEHLLANASYQNRLASALLAGIKGYFEEYRPYRMVPRLRVAGNGGQYTVHQGDTLSGIAANYQVSLASLRAVNGINSDMIQAGETLKIPTGG